MRQRFCSACNLVACVVQTVMDALAIKQAELKAVVDKLAALDAQLAAAETKKSDLEVEFKLCSDKLARANKLIGGLGGEKARWTESAEALGVQLAALPGDMLLAAAYIAYLGPFTSAYRCALRTMYCNDHCNAVLRKLQMHDVVCVRHAEDFSSHRSSWLCFK